MKLNIVLMFVIVNVFASTNASAQLGGFGVLRSISGALSALSAESEEEITPDEQTIEALMALEEQQGLDPILALGAIGAGLSQSAGTTDLLLTFVSSQVHLIDAQIGIAKSLDLAEEVQELEAAKLAFQSGKTDRDSFITVRSVTGRVNFAIDTKMEQSLPLDAESKESFSTALVSYFLALAELRSAVLVAGSTGTSLLSGGIMGAMSQLGDAAVKAYIVIELPGYIRDMVKTGANITSFAGKNDIKVPANATALLGMLP